MGQGKGQQGKASGGKETHTDAKARMGHGHKERIKGGEAHKEGRRRHAEGAGTQGLGPEHTVIGQLLHDQRELAQQHICWGGKAACTLT